MSSLTPFIRHQMEDLPGPSAAPENSCSRCSPPLGKAPDSANKPDSPDILLPGDPTAPGTQVPPHIETPGQTPRPRRTKTPAAPGPRISTLPFSFSYFLHQLERPAPTGGPFGCLYFGRPRLFRPP